MYLDFVLYIPPITHKALLLYYSGDLPTILINFPFLQSSLPNINNLKSLFAHSNLLLTWLHSKSITFSKAITPDPRAYIQLEIFIKAFPQLVCQYFWANPFSFADLTMSFPPKLLQNFMVFLLHMNLQQQKTKIMQEKKLLCAQNRMQFSKLFFPQDFPLLLQTWTCPVTHVSMTMFNVCKYPGKLIAVTGSHLEIQNTGLYLTHLLDQKTGLYLVLFVNQLLADSKAMTSTFGCQKVTNILKINANFYIEENNNDRGNKINVPVFSERAKKI